MRSRLLRTRRGLQRLQLCRHRDARELRGRIHCRCQLHTGLQRTNRLRQAPARTVVDADDATVSIHIDLQLGVVHRDSGVTLLQINMSGARHARMNDIQIRHTLVGPPARGPSAATLLRMNAIARSMGRPFVDAT